jgi:hypothetical protein
VTSDTSGFVDLLTGVEFQFRRLGKCIGMKKQQKQQRQYERVSHKVGEYYGGL